MLKHLILNGWVWSNILHWRLPHPPTHMEKDGVMGSVLGDALLKEEEDIPEEEVLVFKVVRPEPLQCH